MSYLLDTNVISERIKLKPDPNVVRWLDSIPSDMQHISAHILRNRYLLLMGYLPLLPFAII